MNTVRITETRKQFLSERRFRPMAEIVAIRPHGDRLRYIAGCRCDLCRKANTAYERERQQARKAGDWNGIVPADKAREHLLALSLDGVGRRAVSDVTNLSSHIIFEIRSGKRTQIRGRTERLILAVTTEMAAENSLVPAGPTWELIGELLKAGFTKTRIAQELNGANALQLSKTMVALRNASAISKIHKRLMTSDQALTASAPTVKQIATLREEGFTEKQLARLLEMPHETLPKFGPKLSQGFKSQVQTLYERLTT